MDSKGTIAGIFTALVGLAMVAVIVSGNSNTSGVLGATGSSFAQALRCAMSPIIGGGNCGTSTSSTINFGVQV